MKLRHVILSGVLTTAFAFALLSLVIPQTASAGKPVIKCFDCATKDEMTSPPKGFNRPEAKQQCEFSPVYCTLNDNPFCSNTTLYADVCPTN